jgi:hypothetical protein
MQIKQRLQSSCMVHARRRLRDVLTTRWVAGSVETIGTFIDLELLVGAILRWHVFIPSDIISGNSATASLREFYNKAKAEVGKDSTVIQNKMFEKIFTFLKNKKDPDYIKISKQLTEMKNPSWIVINGKTNEPEIGPNNPRKYRLNPKLRLLDDRAGSFQGFSRTSQSRPNHDGCVR